MFAEPNYSRTRRGSNIETLRPNHYMPAYIKDCKPHICVLLLFGLIVSKAKLNPSKSEFEPILEWPLVEYGARRHLPMPLLYFDAGFNPRHAKFEVCTLQGGRGTPLAPEERNAHMSNNTLFQQVVITNETLKKWPIVVYPSQPSQRIRVIDVFRAIYDTYAVPLTREELALYGPDYIQRCERAFLQRCKDAKESTHFLEKQGMTRIDLLKGRRIFKGLVHRSGFPNHHFELIFDKD